MLNEIQPMMSSVDNDCFNPATESVPIVAIIDDDTAVGEAIQMLIESYGWRAPTYDSAEIFLESLRQARPSCLVLDLLMPGMNGVELQRALAVRRISIPVVVVTVYSNHPLAAAAKQAGAQAVLAKPFDERELLDNIKRAIVQAG